MGGYTYGQLWRSPTKAICHLFSVLYTTTEKELEMKNVDKPQYVIYTA